MKKWLVALCSVAPLCGLADTLYLCKAYSGGTFWASAHCSGHRALIEKIVNVPSGLPFDQQVQIAQQQNNPTANRSQQTVVINQVVNQSNPVGECAALKGRVAQLDSMARQPQTGQMQDWISAEKAKSRSRQFQLRC